MAVAPGSVRDVSAARIHVERESRAWMDRARAYKILVDGQEAGRVRNGQSVTIEVAPGAHQVQAAVDWARSPAVPVQLADGQEVRLRCRPRANPATALIWVIAKHEEYIVLEPVV